LCCRDLHARVHTGHLLKEPEPNRQRTEKIHVVVLRGEQRASASRAGMADNVGVLSFQRYALHISL